MENKKVLPNKKIIQERYAGYKDVFTEILEKVELDLRKNIKLSSNPTYKARIKSFGSYYKKILRQKAQESSTSDSLVTLTDMIGIRIVCPFVEDLSIVEKQMCELYDVKEVEKKKADREEVQVEKPVKSKEDIVVEEAMAPPPEKKENAHENPDAAKTDKNPPSRHSSGAHDTKADKGDSKSDGKKPSVKEKLERYKAEHAAGQKKEAERYQPKHIQEKKTPSKTRQTKHKQPKKKQKAKYYKSKER